jgi:glucose/arabinose dehydrogenase
LAGFVALLAIAGCGGGGSGGETATTSAPAQQDGGGGGRAPSLRKIGDFDQPVYVTQADGDPGHLYVVEQCGRIVRTPIDGGAQTTFLDISDLVTCGGEQGLLSVAFAPDYADSGLLYVNYTDTSGDSRTVSYERSSSDPATADPASARELVRIADFANNHNGGLLLFGPDGRLYLGMGDGGGEGDPERTAQNPQSPLGKLLRIDPATPGEPEIAALGLRNPWRYSFDRRTGALWIGDVGQNEWEEIDALPAGRIDHAPAPNFGWSAFEGTHPYNDDQHALDAIQPVLEYSHDHGCSVTGGYVVRDPSLPSLDGRYIYADFCAGDLRSFPADPNRPATDDRPLGLRVPDLSSFGEDLGGRIYVVSLDGPIYRIEPG